MTYSEMIMIRIPTLCKRRRIAYSKLAAMYGLDQPTIDNIVRGVAKDPRVQTFHHIALGFSMALAEFLDYPELNRYSFDEEER